MKKLLKKLDRRFQLSRRKWLRRGSVLILVVALLVLMALIGTAFLSTTRVDRYAMVQHTNNTEIDLLLEGVKNMAKGTITGALNDPSLPFPYRPANSSIAKNWDMPDMYHQFTDDAGIGTTANDAWLSPRCPSFHMPIAVTDPVEYATAPATPLLGLPVWPCIGEPLTGNVFESPFVLPANGTGALISGKPFTYHDRMTVDYVPATAANPTPTGTLLTPAFGTISYPDGTSATFPTFMINLGTAAAPVYYNYLAGDADGDGMADCGMFKLPVGQIDGITYYAGVRIIDNCAAVNVNTAGSRRYDFDGSGSSGTGVPSRYINSAGVVTYNTGIYNLGCFPSNVGMAELLKTYAGDAADNSVGSLGTEFSTWMQYLLGNPYYPSSTETPFGVTVTTGTAPGTFPIDDTGSNRTDFVYTTFGDVLANQVARRPSNPGFSGSSAPGTYSAGTLCLAATDTDAAAICYHFIFNNPNTTRTPLELLLHNSLYDLSPNSPTPGGPPNRPVTSQLVQYGFTVPGPTSTSYVGNPSNAAFASTAWYGENFDWKNESGMTDPESCTDMQYYTNGAAGGFFRSRRSIFTANSAVSNLTPKPLLTAFGTTFPITVVQPVAGVYPMSQITSTLCKASINTATFPDLWRAFWLAMTGDNGLSPLGTNSGTTIVDHALQQDQSIYTGSTFTNPPPTDSSLNPAGQKTNQFITNAADPGHPQAMLRSSLRNPTGVFYQSTVGSYSYIEPDQMILLRSAIAAANVEAMRDPVKGSAANIHAHDVALTATIDGTTKAISARVYGVTQQPYITEVYANTNTSPNADGDGATAGQTNTVPYVAVELFNPYNQDINLAGWQLARVDRSPGSDNARNVTVIHTFTAADIVPHYPVAPITPPATGTTYYQGGYALLENLGTAAYRPASTRLPATTSITAPYSATTGGPVNDIIVPELGQVISVSPSLAGEELVLLRPIVSGVAETVDQVPVDSYDFTGLTSGASDANGPVADVWHYVRGNQANPTSNSLWRFIYPGRYDATDPTPYNATASTGAPTPVAGSSTRSYAAYTYQAYSRRQQGTQAGHFHPTALGISNRDPFGIFFPTPQPTLGFTPGNDNPDASYPVTFPFQYLNNDDPGPRPMAAPAAVNSSPFGQFARNSDILQVPFVGSYLIFNPPTGTTVTAIPATGVAGPLTATEVGYIAEANSMPMDCSFAEDTDLTDDPPSSDAKPAPNTEPYIWSESVGHFAPVNTQAFDQPLASAGYNNQNYRHNATTYNRLVADSDPTLSFTNAADPYAPYKTQYTTDLNGTPPNAQKYWRYHWASRIFDYLTVQNPNDDYFPNVQQLTYNGIPPAYTAAPIGQPLPLPVQNTALISPAASVNPSNPNKEDTVPVNGMINLNTAPWRVLTGLRICPYDDAEYDSSGNPLAAQFSINYATGAVTRLAPPPTVALAGRIPDNVSLAQAIAYWRDSGPPQVPAAPNVSSQVNTANYPYTVYKGPFTSVADVLNVPAVQNYLNALCNVTKTSPEPDAVFGHLSPNGFNTATPPAPLTDGVRNDVEERFDLLSRLSNQATVKSDTYTVYIVVQGWRNAGSTSTNNPPQMVSQRRAAFIIDRTGVTPTSSNVKIINVPTD